MGNRLVSMKSIIGYTNQPQKEETVYWSFLGMCSSFHFPPCYCEEVWFFHNLHLWKVKPNGLSNVTTICGGQTFNPGALALSHEMQLRGCGGTCVLLFANREREHSQYGGLLHCLGVGKRRSLIQIWGEKTVKCVIFITVEYEAWVNYLRPSQLYLTLTDRH